jgi:predicted membrane-bound spermidine synthase
MSLSDEEYKAYDAFVQAAFINVHSYAIRHNNTIQFKHFDINNKEHLLFLSVAKQAAGLYGYKIQANIPLIQKLFNKKYRRIKNYNGYEGIIIEDYLDFMCVSLKFPREKVIDIYEEYYERKK